MVGIEPTTYGFGDRCATNCATPVSFGNFTLSILNCPLILYAKNMSAIQLVRSLWLVICRKKQILQTTNRRGFTLIELMIAISIVAIISAVGLVTYSRAQILGRDAKRKQDLRSIQVALELFYQKNRRYPCSGNWLSSGSGTDWLKDVPVAADPGCPVTSTSIAPTYINRTPQDPLNTGVYIYRIWTEGWNACTMHQGYMLVTDLENSSDKDTITNTPTDICGTTTPQGAWGANFPSNNAFIISERR